MSVLDNYFENEIQKWTNQYLENKLSDCVARHIDEYFNRLEGTFYDINGTCNFLGITRPTLRFHTKCGNIQSIRMLNREYYRIDDILRFQKLGLIGKKTGRRHHD